jgi:hypothetical protein
MFADGEIKYIIYKMEMGSDQIKMLPMVRDHNLCCRWWKNDKIGKNGKNR